MNGALKSWGQLEGTYQLSENYNGKPTWTSSSNVMWHDPWEFFCIGSKTNIGRHTCAIVFIDGTWEYSDRNSWTGWTISTANDVQIKC